MKKPEIMTMGQFNGCSINRFNQHHGTDYVYFKEWIKKPAYNGTKQERYDFYVKWFIARYTKLGQALQ